MRLHNLSPRPGAKTRRKRLGQGESSGHGKTSTRGSKGAGSRTGSAFRPGFEGGQMPLYRRLPKRGFNNVAFGTYHLPVNVQDLNCFEDGQLVNVETLRKAGLANGTSDGVKILGAGKLSKKLNVSAHAFSAKAKSIIEAAGGSCEVIKG
ncbi:MAG: 50S ribosomal protein L15 [Pedosphaera sp.]|nr:50S ribosomal protein L15 [Pedosphaera sp.]